MKKMRVFLALAMSAILLAGCGKPAGQQAVNQETAKQDREVTFQDSLGHEITVKNPKKVAVLMGSFVDVWQSAGGMVSATVKDSWTNPNLKLGNDVVNLGDQYHPNLEQLISEKPDFIIGSSKFDAQTGLYDQLKQAGIPAAFFKVDSFDDYLSMLKIMTDITGRTDLYEQNGIKVQEQIAQVKKRADGSHPRVLVIRVASSGAIKVMGSNEIVLGEILKDLGAKNVADTDSSIKGDFSMEAVVASNPDYIFATTMGSDTDKAKQAVDKTLSSDPAWQSLTAVKQGKFHMMDKFLYQIKPNANWGKAYEGVADILFPKQEGSK